MFHWVEHSNGMFHLMDLKFFHGGTLNENVPGMFRGMFRLKHASLSQKLIKWNIGTFFSYISSSSKEYIEYRYI